MIDEIEWDDAGTIEWELEPVIEWDQPEWEEK